MSSWPELDAARDHETFAILHLASQMLGKVRVRHAPWTNHGWHVALQPNARGLAALPTAAGDGRTFTLALDLCRHAIVLTTSAEEREELPLDAGSVANALRKGGILTQGARAAGGLSERLQSLVPAHAMAGSGRSGCGSSYPNSRARSAMRCAFSVGTAASGCSSR